MSIPHLFNLHFMDVRIFTNNFYIISYICKYIKSHTHIYIETGRGRNRAGSTFPIPALLIFEDEKNHPHPHPHFHPRNLSSILPPFGVDPLGTSSLGEYCHPYWTDPAIYWTLRHFHKIILVKIIYYRLSSLSLYFFSMFLFILWEYSILYNSII